MRKTALYSILLGLAVIAYGCGEAKTTATKAEEDNYANPVKTIPPEAGGPPPTPPAAAPPTGTN